MKVIAIVGYHNTGKTTLIKELVKELKRIGYKVGYIKHDPKGHGKTDKEGSDTDKLFKEVEKVALLSPGRMTLWEKREDDPIKVVKEYFAGFDIVVLEGFKSLKDIPKVAIGEVGADNVILRVEGLKDVAHIIELLKGMEDNL
ncbi:molybdopterin-guanine dinucleotide biosynthesis protein B [Hydrogenivirga caldilitoris]|uniref:Molybdopterin-guanine dinucleotide biosynthesis protein B n=1 Tax=Hydrogenivirga caldilitoris TaxID=246264 RepID=A0A497XMR5_9AQUI|nr:molybdopterin-guanine dinucleotide biosynthesis protein B [Hydrogenivirga caldilitoris]RLJ70195.1 molybdopterin-guanine dinucleotide biosynthesis protein B [Hydrogenivirga caldilitoris]